MELRWKLLLWAEGLMLMQGFAILQRPTLSHVFVIPVAFAVGFGISALYSRRK